MTKPLNVIELECSACGKKYDPATEQHLCTCGKPLLARYDLMGAKATLTLENLKTRPRTLWRYAEVLPNDPPVSLGEGMTALVHAERLGASMKLKRLFIKDEGLNPTGSFKARGMTAAVSRAKQLGAKARRAERRVQGVRRNEGNGLDRRRAGTHGGGSGGGLRAGCESMGGAPDFGGMLPERQDRRVGATCTRAIRRSIDLAHAAADE